MQENELTFCAVKKGKAHCLNIKNMVTQNNEMIKMIAILYHNGSLVKLPEPLKMLKFELGIYLV